MDFTRLFIDARIVKLVLLLGLSLLGLLMVGLFSWRPLNTFRLTTDLLLHKKLSLVVCQTFSLDFD